jgi:cysteine desulfurase
MSFMTSSTQSLNMSAQVGNKSQVYLDHNATTPIAQQVIEAIPKLVLAWGNPSSIHQDSRAPKRILRETRNKLGEFLGCHPTELIFTSGASESSNTVFHSAWCTRPKDKNKILISAVEHPSVTKAADWYASQGAVVEKINVNRDGSLDLVDFTSKLDAQTFLVSCMFANNEIGSLFPLKQIVAQSHQFGALVHTDAVQAFGKVPVSLQDIAVDYASFSAHKFYALKGTGVLYIKKGSPLVSLIHGGAQERNRRGGTENVLGIAALGIVLENCGDILVRQKHLEALRDSFESLLCEKLEGVYINAKNTLRLPNTSSLLIQGVDGETLLMTLDLAGYSVSTGAACSSGSPEPSPVLLAIGLSKDEAQSSLRVSFGWENTQSEVSAFVEALVQIVHRLRALKANEVLYAANS